MIYKSSPERTRFTKVSDPSNSSVETLLSESDESGISWLISIPSGSVKLCPRTPHARLPLPLSASLLTTGSFGWR